MRRTQKLFLNLPKQFQPPSEVWRKRQMKQTKVGEKAKQNAEVWWTNCDTTSLQAKAASVSLKCDQQRHRRRDLTLTQDPAGNHNFLITAVNDFSLSAAAVCGLLFPAFVVLLCYFAACFFLVFSWLWVRSLRLFRLCPAAFVETQDRTGSTGNMDHCGGGNLICKHLHEIT